MRKLPWFLAALTVVNLELLLYTLGQIRPAAAASLTPVLRGSALEIVDDHGRVRASIKVQPAAKTPDGTPSPENVILRLIDTNGRPEVKLGASVKGAGVGLVGETDSTYVILQAEGANSSLKLTNKAGRQQLIEP